MLMWCTSRVHVGASAYCYLRKQVLLGLQALIVEGTRKRIPFPINFVNELTPGMIKVTVSTMHKAPEKMSLT